MLVEDDTLSGEAIKVRGVDFGSVPADISPAQVIGNEKKDVRSFAGSNRQKGAERTEKEEGHAMEERTHEQLCEQEA